MRRIAAMAVLFAGLFATLAAGIPSWAPAQPAAAETITVFGAASLTEALEAVGRAYRARSPDDIRFSFAASSTLARQIAAGAPADIFASANRRWMDHLEDRNLILAETRTSPIANRLVLVAPAGAAAPVDPADAGAILGALGRGRIAVGDPAHVPAGIYAREALTALGLWGRLRPRLAAADNVRAALALVARGEAPLGIVYATDARISPDVRIVATIPAHSHAPIDYPFAIVAGRGSPAVGRFFAFLASPDARGIFRDFGFDAAAAEDGP